MQTDAKIHRAARAAFWSYATGWTLILIMPDPLKMLGVRDVLPLVIVSGRGHLDKLVHVAGYFTFMLSVGIAYRVRRGEPQSGVALGRLFFVCLAHGAFTELLQWATGWRDGEFADWLADATGATLCVLLFWWLQRGTAGRPECESG